MAFQMYDIPDIILKHYHNLKFFGHTSRIPSQLLVELCQYPFKVPLGILSEMLRIPLEFLWETPLSYLDQFIQDAFKHTLGFLSISFGFFSILAEILQDPFRSPLGMPLGFLQNAFGNTSKIHLEFVFVKVLPNI